MGEIRGRRCLDLLRPLTRRTRGWRRHTGRARVSLCSVRGLLDPLHAAMLHWSSAQNAPLASPLGSTRLALSASLLRHGYAALQAYSIRGILSTTQSRPASPTRTSSTQDPIRVGTPRSQTEANSSRGQNSRRIQNDDVNRVEMAAQVEEEEEEGAEGATEDPSRHGTAPSQPQEVRSLAPRLRIVAVASR